MELSPPILPPSHRLREAPRKPSRGLFLWQNSAVGMGILSGAFVRHPDAEPIALGVLAGRGKEGTHIRTSFN